MKKEEKKIYLDLIQNLKLNNPVLVSYITNFIETYDGTNDKEFTMLIFGFLNLLNSHEEVSVRAKGFDKLLEIRKDFDKKLEDMEDEFEEEMNPMPAAASSDV